MKPLHKISLQFEKNEMFYKVANISIGGIGFFSENRSFNGNRNPLIQLNIDTKKFEVRIGIIYQGDKVTGSYFINPEAKLTEAIENYFVTELAALKVNKVESKSEGATHGKMIFFRGQNNCEILIHERDDLLAHFSIILFGNYIEGSGNGPLCFGENIDSSIMERPNGVHLFKSLQEADPYFIESAIRFIDSVRELSDKQKKSIISLLANSSRLKTAAK